MVVVMRVYILVLNKYNFNAQMGRFKAFKF